MACSSGLTVTVLSYFGGYWDCLRGTNWSSLASVWWLLRRYIQCEVFQKNPSCTGSQRISITLYKAKSCRVQ